MNKIFQLAIIISLCFACGAQNSVSTISTDELSLTIDGKPKLVVGIVVDQMRYDYLTRFANKYGKGGFKRLIAEGFNCKNNHFNYIPTYTGPGHASIYTGTTPKYHGVISNNWYDKAEKKTVYCAEDNAVETVGTLGTVGQMSPHRMATTTFSDENRLYTQMRGKSIGISIKDRGAVLPAGHNGNAAYWFHGVNEGIWISSSYYMESLPQWVKDFNASSIVEDYLGTWETLFNIESYTESGPDLNNFEGGFDGKDTATFPYNLKTLSGANGGYDILRVTPFGNSIVTDFAMAAIDAEALGKDNHTDVLAISYSSTDYIGHNFGVNSKEIQDTYLRLDLELERLLNALDAKVGRANYTVFLTSDHGAVHVPAYLKSTKIPAGYINNNQLRQKLNLFMTLKYGRSDLVENVSNNQVFLDRAKIKEMNLNLAAVQQAIVNEIISYVQVDKVFSATTIANSVFNNGVELLLQNGYNQKRSGDVLIVNKPATISYNRTGSTHGSGLNYDTHVPLIFYGQGIKKGSTLERTRIIDIAPTISALLGISFPNGATGRPLNFVIN